MEYPCGGGVSSHTQPSAVFPSIHRKPRTSEASPAEARDAAVRSAKKHLREIVRDDWTYEPSSSPNHASSSSPHHPLSASRKFEIKEWRERDPDTSCSDTEGNWAASKATRSPSDTGGEGFPRSGSPGAAERRIVERRAKRRKLMEEEMGWNSGLRTFVERRDAWSGAQVSKRKRPTASRNTSSKTTGDITSGGRGGNGTGDITSGGRGGNGRKISDEDVEMVNHETCLSSSLPVSGTAGTSLSTAPDLQHDTTPLQPDTQPGGEEEGSIEDDPKTLIPVLPSIIPLSNPVRASIDSSIYPSIYSKVVIQSLTPTIPINLSDMTKCLVQGWKADGQWPPQATTQDPLAGKRKPSVAQYSPVGGIIGAPGMGNKNQGNEPPTPPPTTMRQKRGSGVGDTMRKVLGFPLHPFHLRRGSQATTEQPESPGAIRNS